MFVSCSSQVFWGSPCEIGSRGGNILQTRIVGILEFPRCLVNISQGNMHNFNLIRLTIKYLLIKGRKYINKTMYVVLQLNLYYLPALYVSAML